MKPAANKTYERHYEASITTPVSVEEVFSFLDDYTHFSSHMKKSSWMMGGSKMETAVDEGNFQNTGSHLRMSGKVFGIGLFLDEVVTRREIPHLKVWETVGRPKLLVIDHYRMTATVESHNKGSLLRVVIDYDLPTAHRWLGTLFGEYYARWCVGMMADGVRKNFINQTK